MECWGLFLVKVDKHGLYTADFKLRILFSFDYALYFSIFPLNYACKRERERERVGGRLGLKGTSLLAVTKQE